MKTEVYCTYLYADGHAVVIYEKNDKDAGKVQFAEVHEKFGPRCEFTGRLVLHRSAGLVNLIRKAYSVRATPAKLEHGSDNTRAAGIAVGYLEVVFSDNWRDSVTFYDMPGLISNGFTYQPDNVETFDPNQSESIWSNCRVARIHRLKPKNIAIAQVA